MKNLKTFESYSKEDDEMVELIARGTKFEQQLKARGTKKSKIKLGDTVCIGKTNKAKGSRSYDLFLGKYYRCVGVKPVVLEEKNTSKKRTLTDAEYNRASNIPYGMDKDKDDDYWMIPE